jgi:hypothetical protein
VLDQEHRLALVAQAADRMKSTSFRWPHERLSGNSPASHSILTSSGNSWARRRLVVAARGQHQQVLERGQLRRDAQSSWDESRPERARPELALPSSKHALECQDPGALGA